MNTEKNTKNRRMTLRQLIEEDFPKLCPAAERQRSFIWKQNAVRVPCPNCAVSVNNRSRISKSLKFWKKHFHFVISR